MKESEDNNYELMCMLSGIRDGMQVCSKNLVMVQSIGNLYNNYIHQDMAK